MFTRQVTMKFKPTAPELAGIIENQILPVLRKQKGFRDELAFLSQERLEGVSITLWDTKEDAENYNRVGYPELLKALSGSIEGTPTVKTFEVTNHTLQNRG
jgi:heme-degrading monooxygenase HmoA